MGEMVAASQFPDDVVGYLYIVIYNQDVCIAVSMPVVVFRQYMPCRTVCKDLALRNDEPYQMSRLFHRSLIKYLAGKKEAGISVVNEIVAFLNSDDSLKEENYKDKFALLLENYKNKYKMDSEYCNLLCDLVKQL